MLIDPQIKISEILTNKLNEKFTNEETDAIFYQRGNFIYEGENASFQNPKNNRFSFEVINGFQVTEQKYVPTFFNTNAIGNFEPIANVYDESGSITITWAIEVDKEKKKKLSDLREFKRDLREFTGSYKENEGTQDEKTFYYVVKGGLISQDSSPITLDGARVFFVTMTISYSVSDVPQGNSSAYRIRKLSEDIGTYPFQVLDYMSNKGTATADINPSAPYGSTFAGFSMLAGAFNFTMSIYANPNSLFISDLRDIVLKKTSMRKVYVFEYTLLGETETRNVFVNNVTPIETKGRPLGFSISLVDADEKVVTAQTPQG